jgi:pimeloyl-ACP methyl ester carboxylesterase
VVLFVVLSGIGSAAAWAGFLPSAPGAAVDVQTRPGVTVRYALFQPDAAPRAIAILFVGGEGRLEISDRVSPDWEANGNFLARAREYFRRRGFVVAIVNVPSDHSGGYGGGFRTSAAHAEDIAAVIADLRRRSPGAPVWLVGTSRGTISAADVAARLQPPRGADGLVLTSTVSKPPAGRRAPARDDVFDIELSQIRVPTLITYHRDDACDVVDQDDAPRILRQMANAPAKELMLFEGGDPPQSKPCEARAPHGYFGIEGKVADAIADWILARR